MAKRRILKKKINYIIGELFTESIIVSKMLPSSNKEKGDELLVRILNVQNEYISRISHTEPGNVKGFYKNLCEGFQAEVDNIIEEIGKLN